MTSSAQLRRQFLEYFRSKGHEIVASSPLIPANDQTLLFTNAGMVQFKDCFLGRDKRSYVRAATAQRCVRAGGKHNDLENVGYTARHHTFFEMLGNFSFGDYFKPDAIRFAWEFLTDVLGIPREKLTVTVYATDDEAYQIWTQEMGVPAERVIRIGDNKGAPYASDNFWAMGDTGPCGPCTEIFYDHGPHIWGGPPGSPEEDGDRYIEIWNTVFMQFNRHADGTLVPLPKPAVDTGMGLERLAAVMQGVHSNYEIDTFRNLLTAAAQIVGISDTEQSSLRVIADHIRSCAFLIADGVFPSNEGRGYVLRRIIRRAIRHGYKLGMKDPFFYKLVAALAKEMGEAYPELVAAQAKVERVLKQEEERFRETLEQGMKLLERDIAAADGKVITGETLFRLYDTYGFPVDLTADIARERQLKVDMEGYERAMEQQRERARAASQFGVDVNAEIAVGVTTSFVGYDRVQDAGNIIALYQNGKAVDALSTGESGVVVLDKTPFYAESGGQVGDQGWLISADGARFWVSDTQKRGGQATVHIGRIEQGQLAMGGAVRAEVDADRRRATVHNHSATHLLHAALRRVLGDHVTQKGSLVEPERLRFDFTHFEPVGREKLAQIEALVNDQIRNNLAGECREMPHKEAIQSGAMALFEEKYGDLVRVQRFGDFSVELCGGTHAGRSGDIGFFKITGESGIASGVRRIEAVSGVGAYVWATELENGLGRIAELLKSSRDGLEDKVLQLIERSRKTEKELEQIKAKMASSQGNDLAGQAIDVGGLKVVAAKLDGADVKTLRETVDQLKNKLKSAAIVLGAVDGEKVTLIAGVTDDWSARVKAGDLVNMVAQQVGGRGGGRADMAQAGGSEPAKLPSALATVEAWVRQHVG